MSSTHSAERRAAEIARQLGIRWHSKVASGRYLQCRTTQPNIHIIVFSRYGRDCVGVEGVRQGRETVLQRRDEWLKIGLSQHQKSADSHKTAATFMIEHSPQPDGTLHPSLHSTYRRLVETLGVEDV